MAHMPRSLNLAPRRGPEESMQESMQMAMESMQTREESMQIDEESMQATRKPAFCRRAEIGGQNVL